MRYRRALFAVLVALACVAPGVAGVAGAQVDSLTIEGVNADDYPDVEVVVNVPAALEDFQLPKEAFAVTEDGEPRPQPRLGNAPDDGPSAPPRAVLVIDVSGSMHQAIASARAAADTFVQSLPPGSEVAIVTFGDDVDVVLDFTSDVEAARQAIQGITVDRRANTALFDGVIRAVDLLPAGGGATSGIVLLSDGKDTESSHEVEDAVRRLRQRDAVLWAVELAGDERDPEALAALAGRTGEVLPAANADELDGIFRSLASDLSRRHLLRYESSSSGPARISVSIDHAGVSSSAATTVELPDAPVRATDGRPPTAPPAVHTVTLPLLGTTTAYAVGLVAVATGSLLLWLLILAPRSRTRERLLPDQAGSHTRPRVSGIAAWTTDVAERSLRGRELGRRLDRHLEGAGLDLRPGEVVVIVVSGMVVAFAFGVVVAGPLLGVLLCVMPPLVTRLVLSVRRDRRQAAFSEQLTDVLQLIGGSLRAGYGLLQGIDAIARDAEEPAAGEFRRILVEHRLGRDLNDAMLSCAERMNNADFSWVVEAMAIHRDVGGDLARVLDNITSTVRDRGNVHRQVRAMSAEGRMSAYVLTGLPLLMLVALRIISPDYMRALTDQPVGWIMLAVAALFLLVGIVWIRRMVRVRY